MLTHIGVRNLRSYGKMRQLVDLQKINLFVGRNSSGKSTFLRILPLLRQSLETETLSPILWFGKYVDFGDIGTVKNDKFKKEGVSFDFKMNFSHEDLDLEHFEWFYLSEHADFSEKWYENIINNLPQKIEVAITLHIFSEQEYEIVLSLSEFNCQISYLVIDEKVEYFKISANGFIVDVSDQINGVRKNDVLFPNDFYHKKYIKRDKGKVYFSINQLNIREFFWQYLKKEMMQLYQRLPNNIDEKLSQLNLYSDDQSIKKLFKNNNKIIELISIDEHLLNKVHAYIFGSICGNLLKSVNNSIGQYFKSVRYIGPIRANSDRYYRYQGIQINELDHTGSNLPMILQSLKPKVRDELSIWIKKNLDFQIRLVLKDQHYAIEVSSDGDEHFHNITDMGFGYSQILPIAVTIWFETQGHKKNKRVERVGRDQLRKKQQTIFAIEQPELHLHPAMQYDFGIMVAKLASLADDLSINIVLETHSKAIIDAISNEIYDHRLDKDNVSISLFQKNTESQTIITKANFDGQGYLVNWPAGFLSVGER